jgi:uncharacterized protein (DUF736 family)
MAWIVTVAAAPFKVTKKSLKVAVATVMVPVKVTLVPPASVSVPAPELEILIRYATVSNPEPWSAII